MANAHTKHIYGQTVDSETRCVHYNSEKDVIAIKFYCCGKYYPCIKCHEEQADHPVSVWPKKQFHNKAILCGVCKTELSIKDYINSSSTCPSCQASFNPGCQLHYHLYFDK